MTIPIPQLVLTFPVRSVCTFDNLVVGRGNRLAVEAVRDLQRATATGLGLTGEAGTGKSHLLQAAVTEWRQRHGEGSAIHLDAVTLREQLDAAAGEGGLSRFLDRHRGLRLAAVDDLQAMAEDPVPQEGVLYLFNRLRADGGRLLFASRHSPRLLEWLRPDLRSRLLWGPVIAMDPPGDEDLAAILVKMADDRQVRLPPDLIRFLQMRLPRHVADYAEALDRLDRAGMGLKRPLTVPLAKEVLGL